jgi:hypothetical protein
MFMEKVTIKDKEITMEEVLKEISGNINENGMVDNIEITGCTLTEAIPGVLWLNRYKLHPMDGIEQDIYSDLFCGLPIGDNVVIERNKMFGAYHSVDIFGDNFSI